jgi:hypothetical protein
MAGLALGGLAGQLPAQPQLEIIPEHAVLYSGLEYRFTVRLVRGAESIPAGVRGVEWTLAAPGDGSAFTLLAAGPPGPAEDFFRGGVEGHYTLATETLGEPVPAGWRSERALEASAAAGEGASDGILGHFWFRCEAEADGFAQFAIPSATLSGVNGEVFSTGDGSLQVVSPAIEFRVEEPDLGRYLAAFSGGPVDPSEFDLDWDGDGFSNRMEWVLRQRPDRSDQFTLEWELTDQYWSVFYHFQEASSFASTDWSLRPEASLSLTGAPWQTTPFIQEVDSFPGGRLMRAEFRLPRDATPRDSFYRLLLVEPEPAS